MLISSCDSIHRLNASGRALHDHVVALNIDNPSSEGGFTYRVLETPGFSGVHGDGRIHVVGMTGVNSASKSTNTDGSQIQLWLVNAQPSVDPETGELLDNAEVGGNATIEVFATEPGADTMKHVKTFVDPQIATPNNIALTKDGGFFFTNDHGLHKAGWVSTHPDRLWPWHTIVTVIRVYHLDGTSVLFVDSTWS